MLLCQNFPSYPETKVCNPILFGSMYYEMKKHIGELPMIGVNTFLSSKGSPTILPQEVIRSTKEEKHLQIKNLEALHQRNAQ